MFRPVKSIMSILCSDKRYCRVTPYYNFSAAVGVFLWQKHHVFWLIAPVGKQPWRERNNKPNWCLGHFCVTVPVYKEASRLWVFGQGDNEEKSFHSFALYSTAAQKGEKKRNIEFPSDTQCRALEHEEKHVTGSKQHVMTQTKGWVGVGGV